MEPHLPEQACPKDGWSYSALYCKPRTLAVLSIQKPSSLHMYGLMQHDQDKLHTSVPSHLHVPACTCTHTNTHMHSIDPVHGHSTGLSSLVLPSAPELGGPSPFHAR
eukprot:1153237-Pelagomonas_calceolata.AAC.5